jgi:hypothetical protein
MPVFSSIPEVDKLLRATFIPAIRVGQACPRCGGLDEATLVSYPVRHDAEQVLELRVRCHGDERVRLVRLFRAQMMGQPNAFIDAIVDQLRPTLWPPGYFLARFGPAMWAQVAWMLRVQPWRFAAGVG